MTWKLCGIEINLILQLPSFQFASPLHFLWIQGQAYGNRNQSNYLSMFDLLSSINLFSTGAFKRSKQFGSSRHLEHSSFIGSDVVDEIKYEFRNFRSKFQISARISVLPKHLFPYLFLLAPLYLRLLVYKVQQRELGAGSSQCFTFSVEVRDFNQLIVWRLI